MELPNANIVTDCILFGTLNINFNICSDNVHFLKSKCEIKKIYHDLQKHSSYSSVSVVMHEPSIVDSTELFLPAMSDGYFFLLQQSTVYKKPSKISNNCTESQFLKLLYSKPNEKSYLLS